MAAVTHTFTWALAVGPDQFAALPRCSCGWVGPLCWNVRAAHMSWSRHAEASETVALTTVAPAHDVIVSPAAFGTHVARCKSCGWFTAPLPFNAAQTEAAKHRTTNVPAAPQSATDVEWFPSLWTGDLFDADVTERDAIERHQHRRFSGPTPDTAP